MVDYTVEPPRRDCILHQTFDHYDEGAGRFIDISPQENDATVTSEEPIRTDVGVIGEAAVFDVTSSLRVEGIQSSQDFATMTQGAWLKSEHPVRAGQTNVSFSAEFEDGAVESVSHTVNESVDGWQFAVALFDGETMSLYYARLGDDTVRRVAETDAKGHGDVSGGFRQDFETNGDAILDDVRLYRTDLSEQQIEHLHELGSSSNAALAVGQNWENNGIPYRGNNKRLGGALAENKHQTLRTLDFLREARHIEDAAGKQLDKLGAIAGISRKENEGDDKYRARIQATLAAARSSGTFEDLLDAVVTILDTEPTRVTLEQAWVNDPTGGIATARIFVRTADIEEAQLTVSELTDIMKDTVIAGHDIEIIERGANPFEVINDSMVNDPDRGLTSDSIATGGGLVSDV